jgi:hypothetical protein
MLRLKDWLDFVAKQSPETAGIAFRICAENDDMVRHHEAADRGSDNLKI